MDKDLLKTLTQDLDKVTSKNDLMNLKSKFLGKKGLISELTSELKNLSIEEKKNRGAEINSTKKDIEIAIGKKLKYVEIRAFGSNPDKPKAFKIIMIIGAIANIGIVWLAIIQGINEASIALFSTILTARIIPNIVPIVKPNKVDESVT